MRAYRNMAGDVEDARDYSVVAYSGVAQSRVYTVFKTNAPSSDGRVLASAVSAHSHVHQACTLQSQVQIDRSYVHELSHKELIEQMAVLRSVPPSIRRIVIVVLWTDERREEQKPTI